MSANRATIKACGVNVLEDMDLTHLLAPQQAAALTPSDIGVRLGDKSAIKVNQLLQALGFQIGQRTAKGRTYWEPTEAGQPYAVWLDTGKTTSDGTPVRQLKWSAEIIPLLDDDTPTDGSA